MTKFKKQKFSFSIFILVTFCLFLNSPFSFAESQSTKRDTLSAKSLYLECQQAINESSDKNILLESPCNQKISFFLLGLRYGSLYAPVPKNLESALQEDTYAMNKKKFLCAQRAGYLVAENPDENIFGATGVNHPATFVKWVDMAPERRLAMSSSEAVLSAFFDTCK